MNRSELVELLTTLLETHSPSGDEGEMDALLLDKFSRYCTDVRKDAGENIIGVQRGQGRGAPVTVAAHKDEIGCIVKRMEPDGRLVLDRIGGSYPWRYGEGPMDVLAESGVLTGVLGVGASHTSDETSNVADAKKRKPLGWDMVCLDLKMSLDELSDAGVRPGTRVVVSRSRKKPTFFKDYIGAYALDDKAAVAVMLMAMGAVAESGSPPPRDIYYAATSGEEIGVTGGAYAAASLPSDEFIALEVAPVAEEYGVRNSEQPVLLYKDGGSVYHKATTDRLFHLGRELGFGCQAAVVTAFGSDASYTHKLGTTGKPVCLCFPTENTHGYEVAHLGGIENTARLLSEYLEKAAIGP